MATALLEDRALLEVTGPEAVPFLNGLVTNDVPNLAVGEQMWAALLSPQGKILFDFCLWRVAADTCWLDVEAARRDDLLRRLGIYKLRAAVSIRALHDRHVLAGWGENILPPQARLDPRLPQLGWRWVKSEPLQADSSAADYHQHRLGLGVGEGAVELGIDELLWLEANADLLHGVSFTKGCYVGQENTARMHHRHKVRKRLVPLRLERAGAVVGAPVLAEDRQAGILRAVVGDIALALLRLEEAVIPLTCDGMRAMLLTPDWLAQAITSAT